MSSILFRVPLSSEEKRAFTEHFKTLDKEQLGILTGETLKTLFGKSGLSGQQLSQIWSICDTENAGFLNMDQFNAAMRMIGHLQSNPNQAVTLELYQTPSPRMPSFGSDKHTPVARASPQGPARTLSVSNTGSSGFSVIPVCVPQDYGKFAQLFDRSTDGSGQLPGNKARDFFLKAKLPTQTLGTIWELCDRNNKGYLEKIEFVMAMHLIQLTLQQNPSVQALPSNLPTYLWNSLNTIASSTISPLSANSTGISFNSTGGLVQRQASIARKSSLSKLSTGTFSNAAVDWTLTPEKKKQFDAIFDSLDKEKKGSLGSDVLVPFFLTSKLSQNVLATVWDLADIHNSPVFTKVEFAIAMFLIQKKNSGHELPDVVPDQLLHSPVLELYPHQHLQQNSIPTIPSRDTKPNYQESISPPVQTQQTNNSALDDLLGLNNSFSSSPSKPSSQPDTTIASSHTGYRKFRPTSSFGQGIVQEDSSNVQSFSTNQNSSPKNTETFVQTPTYTPTQETLQPSEKRSTLPNVPVLAAASSQSRNVTTTSYSSVPTSNLSQATTELANLSNQVSSLTKQATKVHEEKLNTQNEISRITAMRTSIENKLTALRASYDNEVLQTEKLQNELISLQKENEVLTQQAAVAEATFHAVQSQSVDLEKQLQGAKEENLRLKQKISEMNELSVQLQATLVQSQENVKQEKSKVDIHSKQLELSEVNANGLQAEIAGLEQNLAIYLSKRKELDDYRTTIENQHSEMESKHQNLIAKSEEIQALEKELQTRTVQIQEQENIYRDQVLELQKMFDDLNARKSDFEKANSDLEKQQYEYADKVQKFSESQMKLAMGEIPDDEYTKSIVERMSQTSIPDVAAEGSEKQVDLIENENVAHTSETEAELEKTSGTLANDEIPTQEATIPLESNLNEHDIPRTKSDSSSAVTEEPLPENIDQTGTVKEQRLVSLSTNDASLPIENSNEVEISPIETEHLPGDWIGDSSSPITNVPYESDKESIQKTPELMASDAAISQKSIDEEFPPIKELHIDESDSSEDENEELEDKSSDLPEQKVFKQEISEKEQFAQEQPKQKSFDEDSTNTSKSFELGEKFEEIDHSDIGNNVFHDTDSNFPLEPEISNNEPVGNDEWDEIFSGLGNNSNTGFTKQNNTPSVAVQNPLPKVGSFTDSMTSKSPVNREIAVTPKSLAIEELSSMGFTKEEATNALEKCDWDLDDATNMLLDGA